MSSSSSSSSSSSDSSPSPERQLQGTGFQQQNANSNAAAISDPDKDGLARPTHLPLPTKLTSTAENGTSTAPKNVPADASQSQNGNSGTNEGQNSAQAPAPDVRGPPPKGRVNGDRLPSSLTDGRVRNPVPPKLQSKTNNKDGDFGVMHLGTNKKRPQLDERDLAAKRSSEATQAAALAAQKEGYSSFKRNRHVWNPDNPGIVPRVPIAPSSQPLNEPIPHNPSMLHSSQNQQQHPLGLPPSNVKAEQARLLTFLRGLHPSLVVDQLCKGLAYFGGVPDAPPPQDRNGFPQSAQNNGSGGLFVGWMSEIFPHAEVANPSFPTHTGVAGALPVQADNAVPPQSTPPVTGKRGRGRPKGSKSTKVRKDKGIKKGSKTNPAGQDSVSAQGPPVNGETPGEAAGNLQPDGQPSVASQVPATQSSPAAPPVLNGPQDIDLSILTPGSKKRGRPKGSKNRPRPQLVDSTQQSASDSNTASGPIDSPTQNVARAAINAANAQPRPSFPSPPPAQSSHLASGATLSQHAENWTHPPQHSPRQNGPSTEQSADSSRKRALEQMAGTQPGQGQQQPAGSQQPGGNQAASNKRRRFSKETGQADNQSWAQQPTTSPATNASQSFGSQSPSTVPQAQMNQQQNQRPSSQQQFPQPQRQAHPANTMNQGQQSKTGPAQRRPGSFSQQQRPGYPGQQRSAQGPQNPQMQAQAQHLYMQQQQQQYRNTGRAPEQGQTQGTASPAALRQQGQNAGMMNNAYGNTRQ